MDVNGQGVFTIKGAKAGKERTEEPEDQFCFAEMAEKTWTDHLEVHLEKVVKRGESYHFRYLLLGPEGILIPWKMEKFTTIASIYVHPGYIWLFEPGARIGFATSPGCHLISYSDIANAQMFLRLAEENYGIPVQKGAVPP